MTYIIANYPVGCRPYPDHYRTPDKAEQSNPNPTLDVVHPAHPMRLMETIRVNSLGDFRGIIQVGIDLINQNRVRPELIYAFSANSSSRLYTNKAELDINIGGELNGVFIIASTTSVPRDLYITSGMADAVRGLIWRKIDAFEAILWWQFMVSASVVISPPNPVNSFREVFALGRAMLMRMTPTESVHALMSSRALGAMLLDNAAGVNQDTAHTDHDMAAGMLRAIPVATNYLPPLAGGSYAAEQVVMYSSALPYVCKRYIYETERVDEVVDYSEDRNLVRVTCERYLVPLFPIDYYINSYDSFRAPAVTLYADEAVNAIATKYGTGTLDNLDYVSSLT